MTLRRLSLLLAFLLTCIPVRAEEFSVFPDRKQLPSPDGRYLIRSVDHLDNAREFSGVFRTLVLEEVATGSVRGLYDYMGRVGVAWSGNNFVIVTDYVSKKTSRALIFRLDRPGEYQVIDKPHLATQLRDDRRTQLERNDHVFLEVAHIEGTVLTMRVWGYGAHDPRGFRYQCTVDLDVGSFSCSDSAGGGH